MLFCLTMICGGIVAALAAGAALRDTAPTAKSPAIPLTKPECWTCRACGAELLPDDHHSCEVLP